MSEQSSSLKTILSISGIIGGLLLAAVGYGALQSSVSANSGNIVKHDERIDEIEDRGHEANSRLIRIETHLERILQVLERPSPKR